MVIALAVSFEIPGARAQSVKYEIGGGAGVLVYQGDLAPSAAGSLKTIRPAFYLYGSKIMSPYLSLRAQLTYGRLVGNDALYDKPAYRQQRNFSFSSPLLELLALAVFNPFGVNNADKGFAPYVFAGSGLGLLSIRRDWSRLNAAYFSGESGVMTGLAIDTTHTVPKLIPVMPVGAGLRYNFSSRLAASAEALYRLSFTDYLDGFSRSANPTRNDHYYTVTVGLIYRIGKKNSWNCPTVR